jgi:putative ABC transport system substrate-binding protein
MRRRDFMTSVGSAVIGAATVPRSARAQQPTVPAIGYLYAGSPEAGAPLLSAFLQGLRETGYSEGQNVTIEYRWARNELSRLPELAADLAQRRVAVIAALANPAAIRAAKAATTTIPVVFSMGSDPVQLGFVNSLNRPGGNLTGVTSLNIEVGAKRIEFLAELVPAGKRYGLLLNPDSQSAASDLNDLQKAASAVGRQIAVSLPERPKMLRPRSPALCKSMRTLSSSALGRQSTRVGSS